MKTIKVMLLMTVIALGMAGGAKAKQGGCCPSAGCCDSCPMSGC